MPISPAVADPTQAFADTVRDTLQDLRAALLSIFESHPGGIGRSRDAQRYLGVNSKLSWQLFRIASPGDALALAPHVPAASAMRSVIAGATERGVEARLVDELAKAYQRFDQLVDTHAGDRASFDSMVRSTVSAAGTERMDLQHRRAMFRACSHYWGLKIETYFTFGVLHPSATPGLFDYANVRYTLGLSRLRADASAIVDTFGLAVAGADGTVKFDRSPLDPKAAAAFGAPLLPDFCTHPLPHLKTRTDPDGTTLSELQSNAVGRSGAVDVAFGEITRGSPLSPGSDGTGLGFGANVRIRGPIVRLVSDMLVHRPTLPRLRPYLKVYGDGATRSDAVELPFGERVQRLDNGVSDAALTAVPRQAEIIRFTLDRLGWQADEFDVYRVAMDYPLMHTRVAMGFDVL